MDEKVWRCPECETVNTEHRCIVCGYEYGQHLKHEKDVSEVKEEIYNDIDKSSDISDERKSVNNADTDSEFFIHDYTKSEEKAYTYNRSFGLFRVIMTVFLIGTVVSIAAFLLGNNDYTIDVEKNVSEATGTEIDISMIIEKESQSEITYDESMIITTFITDQTEMNAVSLPVISLNDNTVSSEAENQKVIVPNLIGMDYTEAQNVLSDLGLDYKLVFDDNAIAEKGIVFRQSEDFGTETEQGTVIVFYVSTNDKNTDYTVSSQVYVQSEQIPTDYDYSLSANIVNGGQSYYDGENYYFAGESLRKVDLYGNSTTILNGTVYYLNSSENNLFFVYDRNIYRMKKDGSELERLYGYYSYELTLYKDKLYFCTDMGGSTFHICSMNTDGSDFSILADRGEWYLTVYNDKIYFTDVDDDRNIYSMNLNGSGIKKIYKGRCYDLCSVADRLYFSLGKEERCLYSISLDGNDLRSIKNTYTRYITYYNGRIYYVSGKDNICSCNLDGSDIVTEYSGAEHKYLNILPGYITYCDGNNGDRQVIIKR